MYFLTSNGSFYFKKKNSVVQETFFFFHYLEDFDYYGVRNSVLGSRKILMGKQLGPEASKNFNSLFCVYFLPFYEIFFQTLKSQYNWVNVLARD